MAQAINEKQSSLNDEAIAIHAAVVHLSREHGELGVQNYIDAVCTKMRAAWSKDHHIEVQYRNSVIADKYTEPDHLSPSIDFDATDSGRNEFIKYPDDSHVWGRHSSNDVIVSLSESSDNIRRATRHDVLMQVVTLFTLGLVTACIVNLVLLRIVGYPLKRLLTVVHQISLGQLGVHVPEFRTREMRQLASAINSMSYALLENDTYRRSQMRKARQIQEHLLPDVTTLPYLITGHVFEPVDEVAGDYYDFLPLSDGTWVICVADVTGHGVPAAMGAAVLKTLLVSETERVPFDLASAIENINGRFGDTVHPENFASMFLGLWNPDTLTLSYTSAGHESAILVRSSGEIEYLKSTGLLLGIDPQAKWEVGIAVMSHGDRVLLFSDGATESLDSVGSLFGITRLADALVESREYEVTMAVINVFGIIAEYRGYVLPHDDISLVLLECNTSTEKAVFTELKSSLPECQMSINPTLCQRNI